MPAWAFKFNELPGDLTGRETPDPIPNSEAKPFGPMVVLRGESRLLPGITGVCGTAADPCPFNGISWFPIFVAKNHGTIPFGNDWFYSFRSIVPEFPSTRIICPVRISFVAGPTLTTQGIPNSRATMLP